MLTDLFFFSFVLQRISGVSCASACTCYLHQIEVKYSSGMRSIKRKRFLSSFLSSRRGKQTSHRVFRVFRIAECEKSKAAERRLSVRVCTLAEVSTAVSTGVVAAGNTRGHSLLNTQRACPLLKKRETH